MFERLDASREADLAAFHRPRALSLLRAFIAIGGFVALFFATPALLALVSPPLALPGFPLGWLLAVGMACLTPSGRGALWVYGKSRSPGQQLRNALVFLGVVVLVMGAVALWRA
jgi:hypothetical protein